MEEQKRESILSKKNSTPSNGILFQKSLSRTTSKKRMQLHLVHFISSTRIGNSSSSTHRRRRAGSTSKKHRGLKGPPPKGQRRRRLHKGGRHGSTTIKKVGKAAPPTCGERATPPTGSREVCSATHKKKGTGEVKQQHRQGCTRKQHPPTGGEGRRHQRKGEIGKPASPKMRRRCKQHRPKERKAALNRRRRRPNSTTKRMRRPSNWRRRNHHQPQGAETAAPPQR